jgi:hypothetical protein
MWLSGCGLQLTELSKAANLTGKLVRSHLHIVTLEIGPKCLWIWPILLLAFFIFFTWKIGKMACFHKFFFKLPMKLSLLFTNLENFCLVPTAYWLSLTSSVEFCIGMYSHVNIRKCIEKPTTLHLPLQWKLIHWAHQKLPCFQNRAWFEIQYRVGNASLNQVH